MTPNLQDELETVQSIIDTVRGIPYGASEHSAGLRVEATACVNFLRTHAPALADMAKRMEAAERDADWVSVKDRLPPENGSYLIAYKWPGHGNIVYKKVTQFLHTAYDTKYMAWNESSEVIEHITHWHTLPADPDRAATQEGEG